MSRNSFTPTAEHRNIVELMIEYGMTEAEVCRLVKNPETGKPIDAKTLRKHFRAEIASGAGNIERWLDPHARRSKLLDQVITRFRRLAQDQRTRMVRMERQHQATVADLKERLGAEAEHRQRTQRRVTELERTVRGHPGLARAPRATRRQPLGVDDA